MKSSTFSLIALTAVLACALALAAGLAPLSAQAVLGRVVAADTEAPLAGVFVTLVDRAGAQAAGFLSRSDGGYLIRAPGPGTYTLRAEMIGYASVEQRVELEADATVQRTLRLPLQALELEGLVARAPRERECALRPEEGDALSRLWETARQGLRIAEWSEESGWLRASGRTHQRLLDLVDYEVLAETAERRRSVEPRAFVGADPELVRARGFVERTADGGAIYHGADAALLLSDMFLETHCFRLAERPGEGLVGLAFEPVPDRNVPDIEGTLWLDAETARLRRLEYAYTQYPVAAPLPESRFGGLTEFRHLPGGSVAVERWRIRMPALLDWADLPAMHQVRRCGMAACDDGETLRELARAGLAIEEEGGRVLEFRMVDGTTLPAENRAAIAGVVMDSTVAGEPVPLSGAEVVIVGTEERAVTDARGRFRLDNLAEGRYRLVFRHPKLLEQGIRQPGAVVVDAEPGGVTAARLALPSPETLALLRCGEADPDAAALAEPPRVVFGQVRDAGTGAPVQGATVRLLWPDGGADGSEGREDAGEGADALVVDLQETDPAGRFLFCDAPEGPIRVAAALLGKGREATTVRPMPGAPVAVDLSLTLSAAGRLLGRVVRAEDGVGVEGALVRLVESGQARSTDGAGRFVFDSVAPGAATVEAEHVAYQPSEGAVAIHGGETVEIELRVAEQVFELEPLVVTARSRPLLQAERMGGFYIRKQRGLGTFFGPEDFEARPAARVSDFLAEGGLNVRRTGTGTVIRSRRRPGSIGGGSDNPLCSPMIYLDGTLITSRTTEPGSPGVTPAAQALEVLKEISDVVNSIPPSELAGIEVYPGPASVPGEFTGLRVDCGVVVIWTNASDHTPRP